MRVELDKRLADLIERSQQTDRRIEQIRADTARMTVEVATIKVELSDEQMDVLLRDIGDLIGKVDALERRIERMDRMLNHKGGDE